jgi:hypothetical protein
VCAFSARAARDELIKWWINLKKNGGKRLKNINDERKSPRERVKAQTFCCVVCCVHFLGEKRNFLLAEACVLCRALFSFLFLFLFFFKVRMYNLVLRVYVYSRDVGVLDLYSSSASDASVCIGTPVLFGVV